MVEKFTHYITTIDYNVNFKQSIILNNNMGIKQDLAYAIAELRSEREARILLFNTIRNHLGLGDEEHTHSQLVAEVNSRIANYENRLAEFKELDAIKTLKFDALFNSNSALTLELDKHLDTIKSLREEHKEELYKSREEHKEELYKSREEHKQELYNLREEHKQELEKLKNGYVAELEEVKNKQIKTQEAIIKLLMFQPTENIT